MPGISGADFFPQHQSENTGIFIIGRFGAVNQRPQLEGSLSLVVSYCRMGDDFAYLEREFNLDPVTRSPFPVEDGKSFFRFVADIFPVDGDSCFFLKPDG